MFPPHVAGRSPALDPRPDVTRRPRLRTRAAGGVSRAARMARLRAVERHRAAVKGFKCQEEMVGVAGFEPATPTSRTSAAFLRSCDLKHLDTRSTPNVHA